MKLRLFLVVVACKSAAVTRPAPDCHVITVTGSSSRDVQRALDEATRGSVVIVPPGRYAIDDTLELRTDEVQLIGTSTVFVRTRASTEHLHPMLRVRASRARISGIRFVGIDAPSKDIGVQLDDAREFRVDHCYFSELGFAGVRTNGTSRGVIDHSTFDAIYKPSIGTDGYGVAVYGTNALADVPFGSSDATFIEDCQFTACRHAVSSNQGARYVFRHNRVANGVAAHAVDTHGTEYGSAIGTEWADVYANVIEQKSHVPPYHDRIAVHIRGGRALIHDNRIVGYATAIALSERTPQPTGPVYIWDNEPNVSPGAYRSSAPPGYVPAPYPHPLASDVVAHDAPGPQANRCDQRRAGEHDSGLRAHRQ